MTGWGRYGMELACELNRRGHFVTVLALDGADTEPPLTQAALRGVRDWRHRASDVRSAHYDLAFVSLGNHGLGSALPDGATADRTVGCIFSEDTAWDVEDIARLNAFDIIVAGSSWNADVLSRAGVTRRVIPIIQGVNPAIWHPAPRNPAFSGRFAVFSGGKLEYRKGQDIVVAAFREFRARHPEALLVTAWQNVWPDTMRGIDVAGHVRGVPQKKGSHLDIVGWLERNGIPRSATIDVGLLPNHLLADIVRACDCAVFPNRAEGGTNLAAMEAIAAGVVTLASDNTGQRDIAPHCVPLRAQGAVAGCELYAGYDGWGETSVDELVRELEETRLSVTRYGGGVEWMAREFGATHSWRQTVDNLLVAVA